ncbi:MAG: cytochrome b N-terminal domain-containing protein [Acidobacteria bacterium]|jgi:quinol-cytochrome oxidoreductase complex cytochrome b subunit|nr:cytochrome b N-terminal domain-containing protein [Acidobacteriota bacterium]
MATPLQHPEAPGVRPRRFWSIRPRSDRDAGDAITSNFLLHAMPAKVSKASMAWTYSFWLGTITAALFLLLTLSGLPLLFLYVPSVERAYQSVKDIEYVVSYGRWLRSVHRVAAHGMVITVMLHLARVFFTGAYKNGVGRNQHREWNWVIGVVLLLLTLFLSFTGYLLPWDQLAFWAVTVGTNIASAIPWVGPSMRELLIGGREIEQATLIRFYVLHIVVLPGAVAALFGYHMWRVRKDGGLARADREELLETPRDVAPTPTKTYTLLGVARGTAPTVTAKTLTAADTTVNAVPDLARRAMIATLGTIALISILSVFIASPLEEPANPLITPNPAKAPWYFLWLQEIVTDTTIHLGSFTINGAFIGGVILPGLLVGLLTVWPWLDRSPRQATGEWFPPARRTQNLVFIAVMVAILLLTYIGMEMRGPYWEFFWPWETWPSLPSRI